MKPITDLTWEDVFAVWTANEGANPSWIKVATEIKGWPDWKSWRMFTAEQLKLPTRAWKLYEFEQPLEEIPNMLVGPFTGWQARLPQPNTHTFSDLVNIQEESDHFAALEGVKRLRLAWPADTCLTGLIKPDGRLVCIEGHHRAAAVALAQHDQQPIVFPTPIRIMLAELMTSEDYLLDQVLARGSTKNPPAK